MVLIGIGNAGHNLINAFNTHHTKISITAKDFPKNCKKTEDYEQHYPDFSDRLKFDDDECWVALCGAGKVAGCTLRVLETIKHKKINIIYVYPDTTLCNSIQLKRNRVLYNVIQEYTRSGLLHRMYLFSNKNVLDIIGDQTITEMYNMINKQIAYSIETLEWLKSQAPVMGSEHESKNVSRICTLSVGNMKKNEEKMLFSLDNITEASYLYSVSKKQLEKDKDMLNKIKERIMKDEENKIISSFAIYPSEHNQSFFYSIKLTHYIQEKK
jgi:hypothetical protein